MTSVTSPTIISVTMKHLAVLFCLSTLTFAQAPPKDRPGCQDSPALTRLAGCWILRCKTSQYDIAKIPVAKRQEQTVEGELQQVWYGCPADASGLQIQKNAEAAFLRAGYRILFKDMYATTRFWLTAQSGPQWATLYSEGRGYSLLAVKTKPMEQSMQAATADGWAQQINQTGRVSIYGINFDTGKATLKPDSESVLTEMAALLQKQPEWFMLVAGHTDSVGTDAVNIPLSRQRAEAVITYLAGKGINKARLTAAGFGAQKPLADNATEEGRGKNRRVDLVKLY
ncbi:MAG TPA: OmpA family protein [Bryobacteraceae bacterium]|nr:OmpA family protein [Bryobacteraceae bacterium]